MKVNFKTSGFLVMLMLSGNVAQSQDLTRHYLFEEHVGGVYTQEWWGFELGPIYDKRFDVYVIGGGKLGDFFGVLSVDCIVPRFSQWRALGGYLAAEDVPPEAIAGIRNLACDGRS